MIPAKIYIIPAVVVTVLFSRTFADIKIIVNKSSFPSVEAASTSEDSVNWLDNEVADDTACTECFAAVELATFLSKCINISSEKIKFTDTTDIISLPSDEDVFLLSSRESNPLIDIITPKTDDLKTEQSFCIKSFEDHGRVVTVIEGKQRVGTLYGVYSTTARYKLKKMNSYIR